MIKKTEIDSDKLKTITLIRHGEPEFFSKISMFSIVKGSEIKKFLDSYNQCSIVLPDTEPLRLKTVVKRGDCFISSNFRRTNESLAFLGVNEFEVNDLFNEAELPYCIFKSLLMPTFVWAFLLRAAWASGYKKDCEPIKKFKLRVKKAKNYLDEKLAEKNNIVVMAHAMMNFTLGRELKKNNWIISESVNGNKFWSYRKYSKVLQI